MSARLGVSWPAASRSSGGEMAMAAQPRAALSNSSFLASSGIVRLKTSAARHLSASPKQRQLVVSSKAKNLGQAEFDEAVLKSELPVLVDFWAEWCGPCKLVAPIVDWAAENYSDKLKVYKVNTEANPELVKRFKPYGLPTLVLFKDGKIVPRSRREGAISKDKLRAYLDELLGTVTTA